MPFPAVYHCAVTATIAPRRFTERQAQLRASEPVQEGRPLVAVLIVQLAFPGGERLALGVVCRQAGEADLEADELGPVGLALAIQPVGPGQRRRVVLGGLANRLKKGRLAGHACPPSPSNQRLKLTATAILVFPGQ